MLPDIYKTQLESAHQEELADKAKYFKMADELEKTCPKAAGILRDIAQEEHTHAELIEHILEKYMQNV